MRLTVQSFQQRFDPYDESSMEKLNDFSQILMEQIDAMSNVASAFSDFATLPTPKIEEQDIVEITRLSTEIFKEIAIELHLPEHPILWPIDRTQWIRVMNNLIKNAIQSVPNDRQPKITLHLNPMPNTLSFELSDNGSGISPSDFNKIFEPKFTTKTGGMGLGLAIVKNIIQSLNGAIDFTSSEKGTTFRIQLFK